MNQARQTPTKPLPKPEKLSEEDLVPGKEWIHPDSKLLYADFATWFAGEDPRQCWYNSQIRRLKDTYAGPHLDHKIEEIRRFYTSDGDTIYKHPNTKQADAQAGNLAEYLNAVERQKFDAAEYARKYAEHNRQRIKQLYAYDPAYPSTAGGAGRASLADSFAQAVDPLHPAPESKILGGLGASGHCAAAGEVQRGCGQGLESAAYAADAAPAREV